MGDAPVMDQVKLGIKKAHQVVCVREQGRNAAEKKDPAGAEHLSKKLPLKGP